MNTKQIDAIFDKITDPIFSVLEMIGNIVNPWFLVGEDNGAAWTKFAMKLLNVKEYNLLNRRVFVLFFWLIIPCIIGILMSTAFLLLVTQILYWCLWIASLIIVMPIIVLKGLCKLWIE